MTANKDKGKRGEKGVARLAQQQGIANAQLQPLSGLLKDYPADVDLDQFLAECKVRSLTMPDAAGRQYLRLDLNWLWKVQNDAKRKKYRGAAVFFRAAKSRTFYALVDARLLLSLMAWAADTGWDGVNEGVTDGDGTAA